MLYIRCKLGRNDSHQNFRKKSLLCDNSQSRAYAIRLSFKTRIDVFKWWADLVRAEKSVKIKWTADPVDSTIMVVDRAHPKCNNNHGKSTSLWFWDATKLYYTIFVSQIKLLANLSSNIKNWTNIIKCNLSVNIYFLRKIIACTNIKHTYKIII